jgi:ferredoxin
MSVKISVDPELCAASAMCPRVAPQLFALPDMADTAVVLQESVSDPELIKLAREAEAGCPTLAITVEEDED